MISHLHFSEHRRCSRALGGEWSAEIMHFFGVGKNCGSFLASSPLRLIDKAYRLISSKLVSDSSDKNAGKKKLQENKKAALKRSR